MLVGITYDLRDDYLKEGFGHEETAEFDKEETIIHIENALQHNGYQTERIGHVRSLAKKLVDGKKWDIVFNISEGMYGLAREAQVPCLLDAYNIPYVFSDGVVLGLTLHKGLTKRIIRDAGLPTPDFAVVESIEDVNDIKLQYPLFAKPVAEGTGKGISGLSKISSPEQLKEVCSMLLKKFKQPVLVERFLPGREFTVGIVGTGRKTRAIGLMEVVYRENEKTKIYSLENKENYENYIDYSVPEESVAKLCFELTEKCWKVLSCRDGGRIDIRMDENGILNFIEVNPLAGMNSIHSDLPILSRFAGISYEELIKMIMDSAVERLNN
ncbi:MAG: D-alanine--D-alanine ligase [Bacteroidetes bacterium GWF2_38_335]|nr:MAG: D-alanine--D-alanine ligase [Bacteroidetes bacterium GWF2_38_335]HBS88230.1 D-alanine--D-alanine ligase [Bacteroidales bacterium]